MENAKLNSLVLSYQTQKCEVTFGKIYEVVSRQWKYSKKIAQSLRSNQHEVIALYQDVLLKCLDRYDGKTDFMNFYKSCAVRRRADLYAKNKRINNFEVYEEPTEGEEGGSLLAATIEQIADPNEYDITAKKKADQRQLIDFLLTGADETTKTIVETFLSSENPTPTAIGKKLGLHHMQVIRKLQSLAGKHDSKSFGKHTDYLFAN